MSCIPVPFFYLFFFGLTLFSPIAFQVKGQEGKEKEVLPGGPTPMDNFNFDSLEIFYPPASYSSISEKRGPGIVLWEEKSFRLIRFIIKHQRFQFPLFIQVKGGKGPDGKEQGQVLDLFIRLPTYFIHDVFLQTLVNRHKRQEKYFRLESNALYQWTLENGNRMLYSAICTLTCFPHYLTIFPQNKKGVEKGPYRPLIEHFLVQKKVP